MTSVLVSFGLAIGWMDILGAIFFQILLIYMLKRLNLNTDEFSKEGTKDKKWVYIFYLILLNIWIVVTLLMMYGIISLQASFIYPWLVWCFMGLILDAVFIVWWCAELFIGDVIEALTNILISALTMAIEFGFIYIIYRIYINIKTNQFDSELTDGFDDD